MPKDWGSLGGVRRDGHSPPSSDEMETVDEYEDNLEPDGEGSEIATDKRRIIDWGQPILLPIYIGIAAMIGVVALAAVFHSDTGSALVIVAAAVAIPVSIVVSLMGTVFDPAKNKLTYPVYVIRRSIPLNGIRAANCQTYTRKTESNYTKLADPRSKAVTLSSTSYDVNLSGDFESRRLKFNSKYKRDQFLSYLRDYVPRCRITRWT
jgi:hypothetical protein